MQFLVEFIYSWNSIKWMVARAFSLQLHTFIHCNRWNSVSVVQSSEAAHSIYHARIFSFNWMGWFCVSFINSQFLLHLNHHLYSKRKHCVINSTCSSLQHKQYGNSWMGNTSKRNVVMRQLDLDRHLMHIKIRVLFPWFSTVITI